MNTAPLRLVPNRAQPDDYLVMSGDERVGRIYKRISPRYPGLAWQWAINRAGYASRMDLQLAGKTASLEQAEHDLTSNWTKILAESRQLVDTPGAAANQRRPKKDRIMSTTTIKPIK